MKDVTRNNLNELGIEDKEIFFFLSICSPLIQIEELLYERERRVKNLTKSNQIVTNHK